MDVTDPSPRLGLRPIHAFFVANLSGAGKTALLKGMTRLDVGVARNDSSPPPSGPSLPKHPSIEEAPQRILGQLDGAISGAREHLLNLQDERGYWCGELEGDTILESEYILLLAWLGRLDEPVVAKAARYIVAQQLPQGGWALFPGGELDISSSTKAYFALKLAGYDPQSEPLRLAREAIRAHGGADCVNSFTRFYLALLGQISYDHCPAVIPELVLLPRWSPINLFRISSWSRTILVPLAIMWAHRPSRQLPDSQGILELFVRPPNQWPELRAPGLQPGHGALTWDRLFRLLDRGLKLLEHIHFRPFRRRAIRQAERWMTDRFVDSDGLGAIFPPIIWSVVALRCLGYSDESAEVRYCHEQLDALMIEQDDTVRLQPCKSPVWDTALTLRALAVTREPGDESAVAGAAEWLLSKEVTRHGDWSVYVNAEPAGWFFEHHNVFYPDIDDTAMVLAAMREHFVLETDPDMVDQKRLVISQTTADDLDQARERALLFDQVLDACERARRWTLAMQNRDGGWAAFDRDNDREFLCHVPFADHNAMIDPSTPDITGRVLEALATWGASLEDEPVQRAVDYLRRTQEPDGSWIGRWGVNYIYGTWQSLVGLGWIGVSPADPCLEKGVQWLMDHQQDSGGWGESPLSYTKPELRGRGPATPSQTAWAIMGLLACGLHEHPSVQRGIAFLTGTQRQDGGWDEPEFTGTGFPKVFYLRYHMYPLYFPLLALGRYQNALRRNWYGPSRA